jgi:DNA-binding transcriptional ArsR family regulator
MMTQINKQDDDARCASDECCGDLAKLLSPRLFKALSDPTRVALLVSLAEKRRPCTVSEIAQGSTADLSVVSRHLAILRDAGVIACVKEGKEVKCAVEGGFLPRLLRDLADALEACCPGGCGAQEGKAATAGRSPPRSKR